MPFIPPTDQDLDLENINSDVDLPSDGFEPLEDNEEFE
jgi:hypothetical protein